MADNPFEGAEWYDDLPDEAKEALKAKHDGEAAAQRLLEKERKERQKEAEELAQIKAEGRKTQVGEALKGLGIDPSAAELFPPDWPVEKAGEWAESKPYLARVHTQTQAQPPSREFVTETPGAQAAVGGQTLINSRDFDAKWRANPTAAAAEMAEAVKKGLVKFDNPEAQAMADELAKR